MLLLLIPLPLLYEVLELLLVELQDGEESVLLVLVVPGLDLFLVLSFLQLLLALLHLLESQLLLLQLLLNVEGLGLPAPLLLLLLPLGKSSIRA